MSGKVEFTIRKGKSRDPRYENYSDVVTYITDENNGVTVHLSLTWNDIARIVKAHIINEGYVDRIRERKIQLCKKIDYILSIVDEATEIGKKDTIPESFKDYNKKKEGDV